MLKCHACAKFTTEIGKIFCPTCGNGGTLRKVAVTVSDNGIVLAARRPRISIRGTKVAGTSNNHHVSSLCFNIIQHLKACFPEPSYYRSSFEYMFCFEE